MRKYFLLSAVALLTATNVNAQTVSGNINLNAEVFYTNEITCAPWNLGTIYLKSGVMEASGTIDTWGFHKGEGIANIVGFNDLSCEFGDLDFDSGVTAILPDAVSLDAGTDSSITLTHLDFDYGRIYADVNISANADEEITNGEYTGSFTFTIIPN